MSDIPALLDLPVETLIVLAGGYLGYRLAYTGKDKKHKSADIVFLTLVFGLVTKVIFEQLSTFECPLWMNAVAAIFFALLLSAFWRRWGQRSVFKFCRKLKISTHDNHQSAMDSILADDALKVSQIVVHRQDGVTVMCNDVSAFEDARTGPFYIGADGSVAIYVTNQRMENECWEDTTDDISGPGGDRLITIIPASQIKFTQIRNK